MRKVSEAKEAVAIAEQEVVDEEEECQGGLFGFCLPLVFAHNPQVALGTAKDHEDSMTARKSVLLAELGATKQDVEATKDDFDATYTAAESDLATMRGTLEQRTDTINAIRVRLTVLQRYHDLVRFAISLILRASRTSTPLMRPGSVSSPTPAPWHLGL